MSTILFDPVKTMSRITDSVLVGFSGGKESIVVLDLCMRYFKNVKVFFEYMVPDLTFEERTLRWYENHYNIEIIRFPCEDLSEYFYYGVFRASDPTFPHVSETDVFNYLRLQNDIWWVATGERINDSIMRRARIKKSSSIDANFGRMYPVANWTEKEIRDYIKHKKLYLSPEQKTRGHSVTCFGANDLTYIKEHYPEDFEKIVYLYPFAGAIVKRNEMKGSIKNGKK